MNPDTQKLLPEGGGCIHFATLVRENREGERTPMLVLQNDIGVFGLLTEKMPGVKWGHPQTPRDTLTVIERFIPHGFKFYTDDGAVLRPITHHADLF